MNSATVRTTFKVSLYALSNRTDKDLTTIDRDRFGHSHKDAITKIQITISITDSINYLRKRSARRFLRLDDPPAKDPAHLVALSARSPQLSLIRSVIFCITASIVTS